MMSTSPIVVRKAELKDVESWAQMRHSFWPASSLESHRREIQELLKRSDCVSFVAERDGRVVGFSEATIRAFANGCTISPVPFAEACWILKEFQHQGIGQRLMRALEDWAKSMGFQEIGSDCEQSNSISQAAHKRWGYEETQRAIYYRKSLL